MFENEVYQHDVETILKQLLLRKVTVSLNKRVHKTGKLIIFRFVNHSIELVLGNPRDTSTHCECAVPYPFSFIHDANRKRLTFEYRAATLFDEKRVAHVLTRYKPSKTLNNHITITHD